MDSNFNEKSQREWFKDHYVKKWTSTEDTEVLIFGKHNSCCQELVYVLNKHNGTLFTDGDYEQGVYSWRNKGLCLAGIAGCSIGRMWQKLRALEGGKHEWNGDAVHKAVESHIDEHDKKYAEKIKADWKDSHVDTDDLYEWIVWCRENAEEVFRDVDHWEWSYSAGNVRRIYPDIHLLGLKMAFEKFSLLPEVGKNG